MPTLRIAQNPAADESLGRGPARAAHRDAAGPAVPDGARFGAPRLLADRLGVETLSAEPLAAADADALVKVFQGPPALHRYPARWRPAPRSCIRLLLDRQRRPGRRSLGRRARRRDAAEAPG